MKLYIAKRLLLVIPTLFGILLLNFVVIQAAPGGPVEKTLAELQGIGTGGTGGSFAGGSADTMTGGNYQNAKGLPPELVERIEKMYGFDKPAPERFWLMVKNYFSGNFGESYYRDRSVTELRGIFAQ